MLKKSVEGESVPSVACMTEGGELAGGLAPLIGFANEVVIESFVGGRG